MNKTVSFILGTLLGAAGGSAATYFLVKNHFETERDEEIADMEEYYEERYQKKLDELSHPKKTIKTVPDEVEGTDKNLREDEKVTNNEGVKKYHHDNGLESAYGAARIFGEDAKPKKKESKLINEISEQEFLNTENGYTKQTVDIFMSNDDEEPEIVGIWAYETDNEEPVDKRFGKSVEDLLGGRTYDELSEYVDDEEGLGQLYLKNDELMIDFEFIIHSDGAEPRY